jgi:hypothetical protein
LRADAASFAARWRALIVGVDDAGDPTLARLASAERDARELARSLADPEGSAVPPSQIVCLTGPEATRDRILLALAALCAAAGADDAVLVYFAGHGFVRAPGFHLGVAGTQSADLAATTVGSADLERQLGPLAVRGVLVILDCCESAALAENAPETFRSLRRGDYRILLSAARADQRSWELGPGQGTLFSKVLIDIVSGRIAVGKPPGVVYFADLMRELYDRIAELRETVASGAPPQEPVYAGAFSKDPLLFVHRGLSLSRIALDTARYSPAYVRRRIRRIGTMAAAGLFFATTVYYSWLQHTQYAIAEGDKIAIYQGYPGLNGPGFPVRLWTLDYGPDRLAPTTQGSLPLPLVAPLSKPVLPLLEARQRPELRAAALLDAGDATAARQLALSVLADRRASFESALYAQIILALSADRRDVPRLRAMLGDERRDVRRPAVGALARLQPGFVFPLLAADLPQGTIWPHVDIVRDLEPPCTPPLAAYLGAVMGIDSNVPSPDEVLDAALRAGCALAAPALLTAVRRPSLEGGKEIAGFARHLGLETPLRLALERLIGDSRENVFARERAIETYMLLPGATCLPALRGHLGSPFEFVGLGAARAIGHLCPGQKLQIAWQRESRTLSARLTRDAELLWSLDFRPGDKGKELLFKQLVAEILRSGNRDLDAALVSLAASSGDDHTREQALQALQALGTGARFDPSLLDSNHLGVRRAAYELARRADPAAAVDRLLARIGHADLFYVEMLGRMSLPAATLSRIASQLGGDADQRRDAACVLGMQGPLATAAALAVRPEADVRRHVADCIPYHRDADEILRRIEARKDLAFPVDTIYQLRRTVAAKTRLERELAALPSPADRLWRLSLIADDPGPGLSPGLRYWIREQRYQLRLPGAGGPAILTAASRASTATGPTKAPAARRGASRQPRHAP